MSHSLRAGLRLTSVLFATLSFVALSASAAPPAKSPYVEFDPGTIDFHINDNGALRTNSLSIRIDGKEVSRFYVLPDWREDNRPSFDAEANDLAGRLTKALFEARAQGRKLVLSRQLIGNYESLQGNRVIVANGAIVLTGEDSQGKVLRDPNLFQVEAVSSLIRGCGKIKIISSKASIAQVRPARPESGSLPCVSREADRVAAELQGRLDRAKAAGRPIVFDYGTLVYEVLDPVMSSSDILSAFRVAGDGDLPDVRVSDDAAKSAVSASINPSAPTPPQVVRDIH